MGFLAPILGGWAANSFLAPALTGVLGSSLAPIAASALGGGLGSKLAGGKFGTGALAGGLGSVLGLNSALGSTKLGTSLGGSLSSLGSSLGSSLSQGLSSLGNAFSSIGSPSAGSGAASGGWGGMAGGNPSMWANAFGGDQGLMKAVTGATAPNAANWAATAAPQTGLLGGLGSMKDLAQGAYSLYSAQGQKKSAEAMQDKYSQIADPFAGMRKDLMSQYQNLSANPGQITSDPSYQFAFDQGNEALNRTAAARGLSGSGNLMAAAQQYGQGLATSTLNDKLAQLTSAMGLGNPGAAAQIGLAGGQMSLGAMQERDKAIAALLGKFL